MRALLVVAHPMADSFTHAAAAAATAGLVEAGYEVTVVDLYAIGFRPAMTDDEHRGYVGHHAPTDSVVLAHGALVAAADVLVFVYPTWWSGLPAILKGWIERVLIEGVAFRFNSSGRVRPAMTHVRRIVGISTYGSPRTYVRLINDNGRRMLHRALLLSCGWRTRRTWLALYAMDTTSAAQRQAFLERIRSEARSW